MKPQAQGYVPSHPGIVEVKFGDGELDSGLVALKDFEPDTVIASVYGTTIGPKAYTSVQCGRGENDHIELNSDLVYVNHSCDPNVAFDLSSPDREQWHLRALKSINARQQLTFFYPSTEWAMDQPFDCRCGASNCLGTIRGAQSLSREELLARGYVSPWILHAVQKRDGA
ncbi:SET domain-containing protein [Peniophora sp. CONT]|nr:SET domain-containing protein [Peniophora sp. CONT]